MKKFSILLNLKKCKILLNFEESHKILSNLLNHLYQKGTEFFETDASQLTFLSTQEWK